MSNMLHCLKLGETTNVMIFEVHINMLNFNLKPTLKIIKKNIITIDKWLAEHCTFLIRWRWCKTDTSPSPWPRGVKKTRVGASIL